MNENTETVYNDTDPELTDVMVDTDEVELEGEGTEGEGTEAAPIVAIRVDELQGNFDEWHIAGMSEDDIIEKLHTDHELSYPGAVNRLRVLKKGAGLTRPKGAKSEDVRIFIQTCHNEGNERPAIIEKLVEKYGAIRITAYSLAIGSTVYLPFGLIFAVQYDYSQATLAAWGSVAYMAIGLSVVVYVLWYWFLKQFDASRIAVYHNMQPVIASAGAYFFLGEPLTTVFVIGGLAVLAGVIITEA